MRQQFAQEGGQAGCTAHTQDFHVRNVYNVYVCRLRYISDTFILNTMFTKPYQAMMIMLFGEFKKPTTPLWCRLLTNATGLIY